MRVRTPAGSPEPVAPSSGAPVAAPLAPAGGAPAGAAPSATPDALEPAPPRLDPAPASSGAASAPSALLAVRAPSPRVVGHTTAVDPDTGEKLLFFWKTKSPFSQWNRAPFTFGGRTFVTSEQWMMAYKAHTFGDTTRLAAILATDDPKAQKKLGREVEGFDAAVWSARSFDVVYLGNALKLTDERAAKLDKTRGHTLVEASPDDKLWGIGWKEEDPEASRRAAWQGQNRLGEVLTALREHRRAGIAEIEFAKRAALVGLGGFEKALGALPS